MLSCSPQEKSDLATSRNNNEKGTRLSYTINGHRQSVAHICHPANNIYVLILLYGEKKRTFMYSTKFLSTTVPWRKHLPRKTFCSAMENCDASTMYFWNKWGSKLSPNLPSSPTDCRRLLHWPCGALPVGRNLARAFLYRAFFKNSRTTHQWNSEKPGRSVAWWRLSRSVLHLTNRVGFHMETWSKRMCRVEELNWPKRRFTAFLEGPYDTLDVGIENSENPSQNIAW